jgi:hypothetical protein
MMTEDKMETTITYKRMAPWETQPVEVQTYDAEPKPISVTLRLTDEHAASSYGIPVLVDESGQVYGAKDHLPGSDQSCAANDVAFAQEYLTAAPDVQKFIERFLATQQR